MNTTFRVPKVAFLDIVYHGRRVGRTTLDSSGVQLFEYDSAWLRDGFSISPLSLPLESRVFQAKRYPLNGMFGVFADSLPDGWGRLLLDRTLAQKGIDISSLSTLDRLSLIGQAGMGALEYRPAGPRMPQFGDWTYDELAQFCREVLTGPPNRVEQNTTPTMLDTLYHLGGSSGGARPKILTEHQGRPWIIKFQSHLDPPAIGRQEYEISQLAKKCGLCMPPTELFPSHMCDGYFGVQRFDREVDTTGTPSTSTSRNIRTIHMVSAAGLLETSHREFNLDYDHLFRLTRRICPELESLEQLFRLMCFNVLIGNHDDHSKNFAYLYNEEKGQWHLAPAFDLTRTSGVMGQHATTIRGKGHTITDEDLITLATQAGLSTRWCTRTLKEMHSILDPVNWNNL